MTDEVSGAHSRSGGHHPVRRARLATAAVFAVHGAVSGSFATRIPWIQERLDLRPWQLGLALCCPAIGAAIAMPLSGRLIHRYGARTVIRWLLALWCAALALPALSPGLPWLCVTLLVYGAAGGTADVAMNLHGSLLEQRLGRPVMSNLHGMWSAGTLIGGAVGAAAAHAALDARVHLAAVAAVLVLLSQVACRAVLDHRPVPGAVAPPAVALPPASALLIGLVGFCAVFAEGASMDWSGVYLRTVTHSSVTIAASAYTAFACTMAVSRFAGNAVIRRLGATRTVRGGGIVATAGGAVIVFAPAPWVAVIGFALVGVGISVVVPLTFAAAARIGPVPSQSIAGVAAIVYASGLIAPALIGAIAAATSLTGSFCLVTVLTSVLAPAAGVLRPRGIQL